MEQTMANIKYFTGATELKDVHYVGRQAFGTPVDFTPVFVPGTGWNRGYVAADRKIEFKSNPSRHECDARCTHATGKIMKCECSCGGKNHGLHA
jgi:hypothetical protein